jgi:hypothetical protein
VRLGEADCVAERVLVDGVVAGAVGRRAAGQFVKLLAHHALLVKTVTQAFLGGVGGQAELLEQVVAAGPVVQVGRRGKGDNDVYLIKYLA